MATHWHWHPSHRDRTMGERAADVLRNGMGSWTFLILFSLFLLAWQFVNGAPVYYGHAVHDLLTGRTWDPAPWVLENLMLSCLAALQAAVLLIAAKRTDQIAARLAREDYEHNRESLALLRRIAKREAPEDDPLA